MLSDGEILQMATAHGACWPDGDDCVISSVQLVALARSIEAAERERCLKLCDEHDGSDCESVLDPAHYIAIAIRAG